MEVDDLIGELHALIAGMEGIAEPSRQMLLGYLEGKRSVLSERSAREERLKAACRRSVRVSGSYSLSVDEKIERIKGAMLGVPGFSDAGIVWERD